MPARKSNLEVSPIGTEMMVFDPETEIAYCLNALAGRVLQACDGQALKSEVASQLEKSDCAGDLLEMTLTELDERGLLQVKLIGGLTRRSFLGTWGKAAVALPIIASIQAPQAAYAQSGGTTFFGTTGP